MTRPADLAKLSPEREAEAVHGMATARASLYGYTPVEAEHEGAHAFTEEATVMFAALHKAGFVVLHEDDVSVEHARDLECCGDGEPIEVPIARLVTPWREVSE